MKPADARAFVGGRILTMDPWHPAWIAGKRIHVAA